ncbi:hypothetical protein AALA98_09620 [Lachnospiraceae bacterium 45-W7]
MTVAKSEIIEVIGAEQVTPQFAVPRMPELSSSSLNPVVLSLGIAVVVLILAAAAALLIKRMRKSNDRKECTAALQVENSVSETESFCKEPVQRPERAQF